MRPDLSIEKQYSNYVIAGVDEVGRGAWAGPVAVSAVIINQHKSCEGIVDSKTIPLIKREELYHRITKEHVTAIGLATPAEIDLLNINQAIKLAIERAIAKLPLRPDIILLDGNYSFDLFISKLNVIKGDSKSISIAAASIVAKVYRDNLMKNLDKEFPGYDWQKNVGYGTASHIRALEQRGITYHHRMSYKPVKRLRECLV